MEYPMSPETLSAIAAALLSLLFSYVPGFKTWYQPLAPAIKRLVMLILLALIALVSFALACGGATLNQRSPWDPKLTCDQGGLLTLIQSLLAALAANQATFLITPKPERKIGARQRTLTQPPPGRSYYHLPVPPPQNNDPTSRRPGIAHPKPSKDASQ